MKKKILFLLSFIMISASGCSSKETVNLNDDIKAVSVVTAENKDYAEYVKYSGFVSADELKRFSFELSGKINDVLVEEGQEVKAGDTLAILDTATVKMAIDNANENIKLANNQLSQIDNSIKKLNIGLDAEKLTLEKAQIGLDAEKVTLEKAQIGLNAEKLTLEKAMTGLDAEKVTLSKIEQTYNSNIAKLQLQYDNAQETFNNVSMLYESGVVTKTDYDNAKLAFDTIKEEMNNANENKAKDIDLQQKKITAMEDDCKLQQSSVENMEKDYQLQQSSIRNMEKDYQLQQTSIKNMQNDIDAAYVKKEAAQISLDQAKISLEQNTKYLTDSTLKSTVDGYVMTVTLHSGEVTSAGTPVVIVKSGEEVINTGVSVEDYNKLSVGMKAKINADGIECYGAITNISLYPDEATRTYNVEILPENQEFAMGSLVDVQIDLNQKKGCFVPISSVQNVDGVDYVYTAEPYENDTYKLIKAEVKLGEEKGESVLVTDLPVGTKVVSKGIKDISENQIVRISE